MVGWGRCISLQKGQQRRHGDQHLHLFCAIGGETQGIPTCVQDNDNGNDDSQSSFSPYFTFLVLFPLSRLIELGGERRRQFSDMKMAFCLSLPGLTLIATITAQIFHNVQSLFGRIMLHLCVAKVWFSSKHPSPPPATRSYIRSGLNRNVGFHSAIGVRSRCVLFLSTCR